MTKKILEELRKNGFRPLAGIMVLITTLPEETANNYRRFPSPCGDYGSYRMDTRPLFPADENRFRPLAGIMVLIGESWNHYRLQRNPFPSPCGDYGSYSQGFTPICVQKKLAFPSPCGDYGSYG